MKYFLAVFRSRSQTFTFKSILDSYKVPCFVVSTPRQINVSCGLSVKFCESDMSIVKEVLKRRYFDTFVGIF